MAQAPKTAAQQQADADALKEQNAAAEREREAQRQASMGDWFKNLMPEFSIMGLLEMAFFAFVLYTVAKTGVGQQALNWLTDKLDPDMQATVVGFLNKIGIDVDMGKSLEAMDHDTLHAKLKDQVSPEILNVIDPNDGNKTLHSFLDTIRQANGGKVTLKGFTSPETITALIKEQPQMTKDLLAAMKPKADGSVSSVAQQMTASLSTVINGPQLDDLLSPTNRAKTVSVLLSAIPANLPINQGTIDKILAKGMDESGKPTPQLRQLFNDALDANTRANVAMDVARIIGTKDAPLLVATEKLKEGSTARYVITALQQNPQAKAAYDALVDKLGNEQTAKLLDAASAENGGKALMQLMLHKENAPAIPQALALLDALPELGKTLPPADAARLSALRQDLTPQHVPALLNIINNNVNPDILRSNFTTNGKFTTDGAVDMLLQPGVRADIKQAGTANVATLLADKSPLINQRNLDAIIKFADTLDTTNPNTKIVAKALAKMATGVPMKEALHTLNGQQLADFFKTPANRAAFAGLLDAKSGIVGNTPALQNEITLLRSDYLKSPNVGLGAILSDAKSAQFLLDHADDHGSSYTPDFVKRGAMSVMGGSALASTQNQDILLELGKALNGVTTTQTASASPTPAPQKRNQQIALN